jgi:DNA-binding CsgD family transcriptional regulator
MLSVIAGELSPMMTGLVYCSVIEVCHEVGALRRAREWTIAFSTWCQQQPDLVAFTGTCLVRRAEILQLNGAWPDAMSEARRACERFEQANRKPPGAAFYQQAEIFRLRGDVAAAEDAYERANRMGFDPQPGLALLRLAQGRTDLACAAIRRVLKSGADSFQRARVLPAYVDIMVASGAIEDARVACDQLEQLADNIGTEALRAMASQARGAVELASNDPGAALQLLRRAFEAWAQIDAPYALARCRILVGMACRSLGDEEAAGLELRAARTTFERLGALPDLARLDSIQRPPGATRSQPLTGRELQVLRLVAAGKTNKAIAAQLALSERTIDRHVSNILTKLDASSRAAAIAHAYDHKLF